ncbi:MAG: hypothetical protein ACRC0X_07430 [Brevinema sp.]
MRNILLIVFVMGSLFAQESSVFETLTNSTGIPNPPRIMELPDLEVVSSIITPSNTLEDIRNRFEPYEGTNVQQIPLVVRGVWWRFYTQTTSLFNIPAVSEEILSLDTQEALWLQDVKTIQTVQSSSQRRLQVAYFDLFNHMFFVFYYRDQDPSSQKIRDKQGFFVRVLSDGSYMQMSTSPNFEPENSMYWRKFPQYEKETMLLP